MGEQLSCHISVIIPAYNVGPFLRKCLDSVLQQLFTNFEVIVVDDGSKDNTALIIQDYQQQDTRVHGFFKENGGVTSARNFGVLKAKGSYLFFLDGDDYIPKTALLDLFCMAEEQDSDVVFGLFALEKNGKRQVYPVNDFGSISQIDYLKLLATGKAPWQLWSKLIRKDLYQVDEMIVPTDLAVGEDAVTLFQVVSGARKISMVNKVVYYYIQRVGSVMHSKNLKLANDNLRAADLIVSQFREKEYVKDVQLYMIAIRLLFLLMAFQKAKLKVDKEYVKSVLEQYRRHKEVLSLFSFAKRVKVQVIISIYQWL